MRVEWKPPPEEKKARTEITSNLINSMLIARIHFLATCSEEWMIKKACWMGELDLCGRGLVCYYVENKTD